MNTMVLKLLRADARLTPAQVGQRLGITEAEAAAAVAELETSKAILAYHAVVDPQVADLQTVEAVIQVKVKPRRGTGFDIVANHIAHFHEVRSLYLMSGGSDFIVFVEGKSLHEVAAFVAESIATLEDVQETVTHFLLKQFKKDGVLIGADDEAQRLAVCP